MTAKGTKYLKAVARELLPPVVARGLRTLAHRIGFGNSEQGFTAAPAEYTTLENPLEVPSQVECYLFCRERYVRADDSVLDVGFGLGYGLQILAAKSEQLTGIDVDPLAVQRGSRVFEGHPRVREILHYDGKHIPFGNKSFDVLTCVEVLEHVPDFNGLLRELARVARRLVIITTPNRRPEYTLPNGKPKNYFHLREWSASELAEILNNLNFEVEWNFLNGKFEGPFDWTKNVIPETLTLVPVLHMDGRAK